MLYVAKFLYHHGMSANDDSAKAVENTRNALNQLWHNNSKKLSCFIHHRDGQQVVACGTCSHFFLIGFR